MSYRRRFLSAAGCWTMVLLGFGCGGPSDAPGSDGGGLSGKLVLTGSSTIAPLASEIGHRFESLHPDVRIDVQSGGSSRGIADARSGAADIGMVSRDLEDEEQDLHVFPIARDGVAIILHADNPVASLGDRQVAGIYTGGIDNWRQVGGEDTPITVVSKAAGRATLEVFLDYFHLAPEQIEADVVIGDNQQGIKTVVGNPGAIGYVSVGTADFEVRQGTAIKLLPAGGAEAGPANLASGAFPISRPLNLVTREVPAGLAAAFLEFARSPQVHDLIEAQFFVPLGR